MSIAGTLSILVIVLVFSYALTQLASLTYGFVKYFISCAARYLYQRRLRRKVHEHIQRRRSMRIVP